MPSLGRPKLLPNLHYKAPHISSQSTTRPRPPAQRALGSFRWLAAPAEQSATGFSGGLFWATNLQLASAVVRDGGSRGAAHTGQTILKVTGTNSETPKLRRAERGQYAPHPPQLFPSRM